MLGRSSAISIDNVSEIENAILRDPDVSRVDGDALVLESLRNICYRLDQFPRISNVAFRAMGTISSGRHYMAILRGLQYRKLLPLYGLRGRKSVWVDDFWPDTHDALVRLVDRFDIENIFVHSKEVVENLRTIAPKLKSFWIPEGTEAEKYKFLPLESKSIDVLGFGRRYDKYHDCIVDALSAANKTYLYEKEKGEVVFPDTQSFLDGIARAKISICVPLTETNPARAGGISTMTMRYLQSILSKCLIVGKKPREMLTLFDYDPLIEIDWSDPAGQLLWILEHYEDYLPLIERNYQTVRAFHTWEHRWRNMKGIIDGTQLDGTPVEMRTVPA
jgi:hypothetical protein